MLNDRSVDAVGRARFSAEFARPLYESYGFARLPATIENLLLARDDGRGLPGDVLPAAARREGAIRRVVVLFIDSFGWRSFEPAAARYPFLARFREAGVVSKLTALFPSTTAAHVTCIHTGLTPAGSGLYEWFQYHAGIDALIAPLLFSFAGQTDRDGLLAAGIGPDALFAAETTHERLSAGGARSRYVTPAAFTPSPYNDLVCRGAEGFGYRNLKEGLGLLGAFAGAPIDVPEYLHFYYGDIDASSHHHGLASRETARATERIFTGLEAWLARLESNGRARAGETLVLLTADHGMVETSPERTHYLNRLWPGIESCFERTAAGAPIVPAGAPRDFFLHVREERLEEVHGRLAELLAARAEVHRTTDLLAAGLFGPEPPSARFLAQVGNLVILPLSNETVWWHAPPRFVHRHLADHGGLSRAEMEIPLAALVL